MLFKFLIWLFCVSKGGGDGRTIMHHDFLFLCFLSCFYSGLWGVGYCGSSHGVRFLGVVLIAEFFGLGGSLCFSACSEQRCGGYKADVVIQGQGAAALPPKIRQRAFVRCRWLVTKEEGMAGKGADVRVTRDSESETPGLYHGAAAGEPGSRAISLGGPCCAGRVVPAQQFDDPAPPSRATPCGTGNANVESCLSMAAGRGRGVGAPRTSHSGVPGIPGLYAAPLHRRGFGTRG